VVRTDFPANSVQELIAYAKANPGKVNFGQGASHRRAVRARDRNRSPMPYRGTGQAVNDLWPGISISLFFQLDPVREQVQAKGQDARRDDAERVPAVPPEVPTMDEPAYGLLRHLNARRVAEDAGRNRRQAQCRHQRGAQQPDTAEHLRGMNMPRWRRAGRDRASSRTTERWGDVIRAAKITAD
jgi:tripartite-type tricarboxylate transporter receptor subunit TctC